MENKSSKEYVAELLKQLEELKRKKAQKERKLQRLKTCAEIDQQKEQAQKNSHDSFHKTSAQLYYLANSSRLTGFEQCGYNLHKHKNYPLINMSECANSDCSNRVKDKENYTNDTVVSANMDYLILKKDFNKNSVLEIPKCNEGVVGNREYFTETINSNVLIFEKNDSKHFTEKCGALTVSSSKQSIILNGNEDKEIFFNVNHDPFSHDGNSCNIEKSYEATKHKCNKSVTPDVKETENNREIKRKNDLSPDSETIFSSSTDVKDITMDNSFCDSLRKDNSSNKSLINAKDKNSDILDDSLNSNISFLFSEFFPPNNPTQEIILKSRSPAKCKVETTKQVEMLESISADPKFSLSVVPDTVSQKHQQNNVDDFNFPKFSTPTDGINFCSRSDENMINSQNKSAEQNASIVCDVKTVSSTECICSMDKTCKDYIGSENKFDPTQVSLIIGKGLSSVLDAHYKSPNKQTSSKNEVLSNINREKIHSEDEIVFKKRKLFSEKTVPHLEQHLSLDSRIGFCESDRDIIIEDINFESEDVFFNHSGSYCGLQSTFPEFVSYENNSSGDIQSQVTKTINVLVNKICKDSESASNLFKTQTDAPMDSPCDKNPKAGSEVLVIPETEGLELCFSKSGEDFLETSTLSENLSEFHVKDNLLNVSSQSRLESPVVHKIVAAVKSAKDSYVLDTKDVKYDPKNVKDNYLTDNVPNREYEKINLSDCHNVLGMDTSFLDDDTQELGNYKQMPYLNKNDIQDTVRSNDSKTESNLDFICWLYGASNEAVMDVEIIIFGNVKYAFIQHETQIHVWCQEKKKEWIKIFNHKIEDMLSLVKICRTSDEDNLVIIMLLSDGEQYCLQFLLFEKDAKIIKLMENTHWLEKRHFKDSVLLCGLESLMFASALPKSGHEVSLHAFIGLKDSPRLMTAVLGSTGCILYNLCKINNLPNALMGINDSMLYVWHVLEARLVTAVSLHPHDYLPIKCCFWATVENGLIYLMTTCGGPERHLVCQLLAANLATGFCQSAMTYSTKPSRNEMDEITKAVYMEPFLVVSNSNGALMWSITDEHCCATLSSKSGTTSVAISRDFENWGLVAVGSRQGYISCYSLK